MIEGGAEVNLKGREGKTPLHQAAERGHTEVIEALLKRNANVDVSALDQFGKTALQLAIRQSICQLGVAAALVRGGAKVDAKDDHDRGT